MANENTPSVGGTQESTYDSDFFSYVDDPKVLRPDALYKYGQDKTRNFWQDQPRNLVETGTANLVVPKNDNQNLADLIATVESINTAVRHQGYTVNAPEDTTQQGKTTGADPVDLATGQLLYSYTDLHIDGAGINFDLTRHYRSQALSPNGPFGICWDYNYNLWLREVSINEVVVNTGEFREDRFIKVQGTNDNQFYFSPPDGYHAVLEKPNGNYILTRPDAITYEYASIDDPFIYKIIKISDRFDNFLSFDYSQPLEIRIVVNEKGLNPTRVVHLQFDDLKRIVSAIDYSGRVVSYTYDDYDDLIAVTLPSTNDYKSGRRFFYQYSSAQGLFKHQLLSVIDADGRRYLDTEYGNNENFADVERVTRQRDDEGVWLLEYGNLFPVDASDINQPNRYTLMVKPTGHCIEYWFNKIGNALVKAETVYDENGTKRQFITRSLYNIDGNLIAQVSPEKTLIQNVYGRDVFETNNFPGTVPTMTERKTFGNLLTHIKKASGGGHLNFDNMTGVWLTPLSFTAFVKGDIIIDYTYEPLYQQLATKSDPRFRFNANYFTHFIYTAKGELEQIIYPQTTGPDPADISQASDVDFFEYDPTKKGRIINKSLKRIDPLLGMINHPDNHTTSYKYFALAGKKGYLSSITLGKGEPDEATTSFAVNVRGIHTKVTDPLLRSTDYNIDSTDQPISVIRNLKAGVNYKTQYKYTREGKVKKSTRDVMDNNGNLLLAEPETTHYRYNDFGLMLSQGLGGSDFSKCLVSKKVYNNEGLPARFISPGRSITSIRYDARRLPVKTISGFGTSEAVTTKIKYNGNLQQRAAEDGAGNVTRNDYDSFGRLACTVQVVDIAVGVPDTRILNDRQGHTHIFFYDELDNIVEERFFEWVKKDKYRLLNLKQHEFDQRGRKIKTVHHLFKAGATITTGANWLRDLKTLAIPVSVPVESWTFYDGNGKIKEQREGVVTAAGLQSFGSSIITKYDHSGRIINQANWLLNKNIVVSELKNSYDLNGNLIRTDRFDYEYNNADALINTEIISSGAVYDAFNRKIEDIDGLGNITSYEYDSRDAILKKTDPSGNIISFEYDICGRKIKMAESPVAGTSIETKYEYDADGQLISLLRGDPAVNNFVKTSYSYNALHKKIKKILAGGTALERPTFYTYDKTGLLRQVIQPNDLSATYFYNHLNQVIKIVYDNSKVPAIDCDKAELFSFDGMGRMIHATNDKSEVRYSYDSLGRTISEEQELSGNSMLTIDRSFDYLNNYEELIYPSGRTVQYMYDLAGRQLKVTDVKRGVPNISRPGGGNRMIVTKTFIGQRERLNTYGNNTSTLYEYDRNGRIISIGHRAADNTSSLQLVQLYNNNGNRAADWQGGNEATNASHIYNYDGLNRLTRSGPNNAVFPVPANFSPVSIPGQALSGQVAIDLAVGNIIIPAASTEPEYDYDEWSNRLFEKSALVNTVEQFDELGELQNGMYAYDLNGNLVNSGTKLFKYNQHNQLVAVTDAGLNFSCIYDATGRRIQTNDLNIITRFAYDAFAEIASYENGILVEEYTIASQPDGRVSYANDKKDYFIHHDLVGSTRVITDSTANVKGRYDYEPYGRPDIITNFAGFRYLFMGRDWDDLIQLYHFRARHYDVETGRFLQNDSIENTDGKSLYQAFGSNPLVFVDPMGTRQNNIDEFEFNPFMGGPNPDGTTSAPGGIAATALIIYDLILVGGGKVVGYDRAPAHLWHSIFGKGEEKQVTKEWVMKGWGEYYSGLVEGQIRDLATQASKDLRSGQNSGAGQFSGKTQSYQAPGGDQHNAAGGAVLSVKGNYTWQVGQSGRIELALSFRGDFSDYYSFRKDANHLNYLAEQAGVLTAFPITGSWTDQRNWTADPANARQSAAPAPELPGHPKLH